MNKFIGVGRLTQDVELRYIGDGKPVANMTIAIDREYKDKNDNKVTDFLNCQVWGKLAEVCANNLGKGRLVAIEGSVYIDTYEKDGEKRKATRINCQSVKFLDWPKQQREPGGEPALNVDDVPF